jgi:hypothetical protein
MNDEAMVASIRLFADGETARTSASVRLPRCPSLFRTDRTRELSRASLSGQEISSEKCWLCHCPSESHQPSLYVRFPDAYPPLVDLID